MWSQESYFLLSHNRKKMGVGKMCVCVVWMILVLKRHTINWLST